MKPISLGLFAAVALLGQAAPVPATNSDLPSIAVGTGTSWNRGDAHATSANVSIAIRLGGSSAYSWSEISTPIAKVPVGSQPLASTVTTGVAYRVAASSSGRVSLMAIGQTGFNSTPTSYSLALTGSAGIAIRLSKTGNFYLMPYARLAKPQRGTDGSLVGGILQPGITLQFGLGAR